RRAAADLWAHAPGLDDEGGAREGSPRALPACRHTGRPASVPRSWPPSHRRCDRRAARRATAPAEPASCPCRLHRPCDTPRPPWARRTAQMSAAARVCVTPRPSHTPRSRQLFRGAHCSTTASRCRSSCPRTASLTGFSRRRLPQRHRRSEARYAGHIASTTNSAWPPHSSRTSSACRRCASPTVRSRNTRLQVGHLHSFPTFIASLRGRCEQLRSERYREGLTMRSVPTQKPQVSQSVTRSMQLLLLLVQPEQ